MRAHGGAFRALVLNFFSFFFSFFSPFFLCKKEGVFSSSVLDRFSPLHPRELLCESGPFWLTPVPSPSLSPHYSD